MDFKFKGGVNCYWGKGGEFRGYTFNPVPFPM